MDAIRIKPGGTLRRTFVITLPSGHTWACAAQIRKDDGTKIVDATCTLVNTAGNEWAGTIDFSSTSTAGVSQPSAPDKVSSSYMDIKFYDTASPPVVIHTQSIRVIFEWAATR